MCPKCVFALIKGVALKKIFLLLNFFLLFSCSSITKLSTNSVKENERLVVLRIFHSNTQGDWSDSTSFLYRLDDKKASAFESPYAAKKDEDHLRYVIVPQSVKKFGLDDIVFGASGFAYHANIEGIKALSEVQLPKGSNPVYVGSFYIKSSKRVWDDKVMDTISVAQDVQKIEIKDELPEVQRLLKIRGIDATVVKAILPNPFTQIEN